MEEKDSKSISLELSDLEWKLIEADENLERAGNNLRDAAIIYSEAVSIRNKILALLAKTRKKYGLS